jgi:acetyl-CoA synthetase
MPSQEDETVFQPPESLQQNAHCRSMEQYKAMYEQSIDDPASFWTQITSEFTWKVKPQLENFVQYNFDTSKGKVFIKWMEGAVTNICYNMLDRNVYERGLGDKVAFYW